MIVVPERYAESRRKLPFTEVSFGCGGIHLFPLHELERGQMGYSVDREGKSLLEADGGAWRSCWVVIGYETALGDPVIMDTSQPELPVYSAVHGERTWNLEPIAVSIDGFLTALVEFSRLSLGRSCPVDLEANPLPEEARSVFLAQVSNLNDGLIDTAFWSVLLQG